MSFPKAIDFFVQDSKKLLTGVSKNLSHFSIRAPQTNLAFKAALACLLAMILALWGHTAQPFWSGISAMTVTVATQGGILQKAWLRLLGTALGSLLAIVIASLFVQEPLLLCLSIFLVSALGIYFACADKAHFYAWLLGYITVLMVLLSALASPTPNSFIDLGFARSLEIILGIVAVLVIQMIFPTSKADRLMDNKIKNLFQDLILMFESYEIALFNRDQFDRLSFDQAQEKLKTGLNQILELQSLADRERFFLKTNDGKREILNAAFQILEILSLKVQDTDLPAVENLYFKAVKSLLFELLTGIKNLLQLYAQDPKDKNNKAACFLIYQKKLNNLEHELESLRQKGQHADYSIEALDQVFGVILACRMMVAALGFKKDLKKEKELIQTTENINIKNKKNKKNKKKCIRPLSLLRAWIDYDLYWVRFALIGTIGLLLGPFLWGFFELPGFAQIAVSVGAVLSLDPAGTRYKGFLRVSGCFAGAVMVLILLGMGLDNFWIFFCLMGLIAFVFLYFHFGDSGVSYFGTQAVCVLFTGLVAGATPEVNLDSAFERLFGIVGGVICVLICLKLFWKSQAKDQLVHAVSQLQKEFYKHCVSLASFWSGHLRAGELEQRLLNSKFSVLLQDLNKEEKNNQLVLNSSDLNQNNLFYFYRRAVGRFKVINLILLEMSPLDFINLKKYLLNFEVEFLQPLCELLVQPGLLTESLEYLKLRLEKLEYLNQKIVKTRQKFREEKILLTESIRVSLNIYLILRGLRLMTEDQIGLMNLLINQK